LICYLDASVIVPLFKQEIKSESVRDWIETCEVRIAVSALCIGEVHAAFSRQVRLGIWDKSMAADARSTFDSWIEVAADTVELANNDVVVAADLVRQPFPKLLMPDAIHVALCKRLKLRLVTLDNELVDIAQREGVTTVSPA
jgi:uncharacterized protein